MKITVLVENEKLSDRDDITAEFGLSMLVEHDSRKILFDTGSTGAFVDNAKALGVDLAAVDAAVVSHRHYDHAGGLARFFEVNDSAEVHWVRTEAGQRFARIMHFVKRDIGVDRSMVSANASRFVEFEGELDLGDGVHLLSRIGEAYPRPAGNKWLFVQRDGRAVLDPFDHELAMVVREPDGMVVFTGCAHTGVLNMVDRARERFPETPIKAIVGGFHLVGMPPTKRSMSESRDAVEQLGRSLGEMCTGNIFTGHCTGARAFEVLEEILGERLHPIVTGTVVAI